MDKWNVTPENEFQFTPMQRRQMELENPLGFHFRTDMTINGKPIRSNRGCSTAYVPFRYEIDRQEWEPILDYYNLDRASCWVIQRSCFPWIDGQPMDIVTMEVTMKHQPMFAPGETFETRATGEVHTFQNPTTGTVHTLMIIPQPAMQNTQLYQSRRTRHRTLLRMRHGTMKTATRSPRRRPEEKRWLTRMVMWSVNTSVAMIRLHGCVTRQRTAPFFQSQ